MADRPAGGLRGADPRRARGQAGEDRAAQWYEAQGWTVLARNWRAGRQGELDLIVGRGGVVVVCEVKARRSAAYGVPAEAVTPAKQARIRRLAAAWLAENQVRARVRFDVVAILGDDLTVIESAF